MIKQTNLKFNLVILKIRGVCLNVTDKEHKKRTLKITVIIFMVLFFFNVLSWIYAGIVGNKDIAISILILSVIIIMAVITWFTIKSTEKRSLEAVKSLPYGLGTTIAKVELSKQKIDKEDMITKTFVINKHITLKLKSNITGLYIDEMEFLHCKYLLLKMKPAKMEDHNNINSIDDITINLDSTKMRLITQMYKMTPEQEFQAHCSNIQAWVENNYDTRILHSNLSFPLLKRLSDVGDRRARIMFKEEIGKRYVEGNIIVRRFLQVEGYLDHLSIDELMIVIREVLVNEGKITLHINLALKDKNGRNSVQDNYGKI